MSGLPDPTSRDAEELSQEDGSGQRPNLREEEEAGGEGEDPRLVEMAQEYLRELEQGRRPDRRGWLVRHPELADALNACFDGIEIMHGAAPAHAGREVGSETQPTEAAPLGDFKILREIGRGGMGIVYEAVQLSLGRRVALKVLPFATSFDAKCLQRFRQEAQAAAQLHHTNIVPVFAVGCERGTHFYAMQLIDGYSLDVLIAQLRRDGGLDALDGPSGLARSVFTRRVRTTSDAAPADFPPTEPLAPSSASADAPPGAPAPAIGTPRDETLHKLSADISTQRAGGRTEFFRFAAELMAQAADALEYAHQQGVIHRDIKPGNLLLDARRELWITDFGLAQFHAEQGLTQTGDLLGTIRYASPEQVAGQRVVLDHRTDIYSLGATFYELITLRPIFAGPTREALLNQVVNQDPAGPRSLDRTIPVELETIVLKAVSKNPADRYPSARALAEDLRRFLRYEPIRATRPTLLDRARKWMRRHPSIVVAAVLMMFVTLVISGVSNWLIGEANIRTQQALEKERLRAKEVETSFRQARDAVDLLIDVSETELADKPPLGNLRKRLLETALVYYEDFIAQHAGNPASRSELTRVQQRVRKILDELTVMEGAGQLMLAGAPDVQGDLQLSEDQRGAIREILRECADEQRGLLTAFDRPAVQDRRAAFLETTRSAEQALRAALSAEQVHRLGQIVLQLQGTSAFTRSDVIAALRLTDSQRQMIRQVELERMMAFWDRPPGGPPVGPGPIRPRGELARLGGTELPPVPSADGRSATPSYGDDDGRHEHRRGGGPFGPDPMDDVLALLTAEQRTKWEELIGPRFVGLHGPPHPGFPGPPRDEPPPRWDADSPPGTPFEGRDADE